jgi:hypothetical protein
LNVREKPAFEYRESYWFTAFAPDWAWRNGCNRNGAPIPQEKGGHVTYKGFVHTLYPLVPPDKYFASHPEWFSLVKGHRVKSNAQLCLTDPSLCQMVVERVKDWLRESPDAGINGQAGVAGGGGQRRWGVTLRRDGVDAIIYNRLHSQAGAKPDQCYAVPLFFLILLFSAEAAFRFASLLPFASRLAPILRRFNCILPHGRRRYQNHCNVPQRC